MDADFTVTDHGSVILFAPLTEAAHTWWSDHVDEGQSFGGAYAVERRYASDIATGIGDAGLTIG